RGYPDCSEIEHHGDQGCHLLGVPGTMGNLIRTVQPRREQRHGCVHRRGRRGDVEQRSTDEPGPLRDPLAMRITSRLDDTQYRSLRVHASVTVVERAMMTPPVEQATLPAFTPMGTPCMQPISRPRAMRALLFTAVVLGMVHSGIEAADQEPQIF